MISPVKQQNILAQSGIKTENNNVKENKESSSKNNIDNRISKIKEEIYSGAYKIDTKVTAEKLAQYLL